MSQLERLQESRNGSKKAKEEKKGAGSGIHNYKPSESVKKLLRDGGFTLEQALGVIDDRVNSGVGVSITYNEQGHAISLIARDRRVPWNQGLALAVNHSDLVKGLITLGYYLSEVNPGFPETPPANWQLEFDW